MNIESVKQQALKEIEEEDFRKAVDKYKEELKIKKSFWDSIFPYKVIVIKKGENNGR